MTRIEELLRQSLTELPMPESTYPAVMVGQRARRARRRAALAATLAVAAAVAAIVVPLAAFGGGSEQHVLSPDVRVPSPTTLLAPSGVNAGVSWVSAAPGGSPWALVNVSSSRCPGCTNAVLSRVGTSGVDGPRYPVTFPGVVVATPHLVWVVGGIEDRTWVSVLNIVKGRVTTKVFANDHLSAGSADGDDLYVANDTTSQVVRLALTGTSIVQRGSVSLPRNDNIGNMVTTSDHHIWVSAGSKLVELSPTAAGLRIVDSADWHGDGLWGPVIYRSRNPSPGAPSVWAWDGRLIALTPSYLRDGTSVAEGYRLTLPGGPTYAVSTPEGGVFVGSTASPRTDHPSVYYFSPQALRRGTSTPTARLRTATVSSMAVDPAGGVDMTVGAQKSKLVHWDPTGS